MSDYVRVCPVCGTASAPEATQCASCGTLLLGVDLTLPQAPAPVAAPAPEPPREVRVRCPHADCAQENPPGRDDCLYCGRPLPAASAPPGSMPAAGMPAPTASLYRLPAALADKFRIVEVLPAGGAEAEIMILEGLGSGVRVVAKLYRPGFKPKPEVLERVSRAAFRHVVQLIAFGESEGIGYEVMEYCPAGSLRQLMAREGGTLARDVLREIVAEIAEALAALHELNIIHRDLKPENVLIRRREPLDLVLTDFGIASVSEQTQLFTGMARTTRYGAPETLSGVLDRAADWWSLGMVIVELVAGRHPFDGLSDAVITHRLITGGVDLDGVADPDWRKLCRGLLLRDPQRRWGGAEIRRWLDGDATLEVPEDAAPPPEPARAARPYRLEDSVCATAVELAVALARHWTAGRKDLMRGQLSAWVGQELKDDNLLRFIHDLLEERGISDDLRLLRLIRHLAPGMPPVWLGESLALPNLLARAAQAEAGDATAAVWLVSALVQKTLRELDPVHFPAEAAFVPRWERALERFDILWRQAEALRTQWRRQHTDRNGVVDFDALVFGQPEAFSRPEPAKFFPPLVLVLGDEVYAARLGEQIKTTAEPHLDHGLWIEPLLRPEEPAGVVVAWFLLPHAQAAAEGEEQRRQLAAAAAAAEKNALAGRVNQALALLRETCDLGAFASAFAREAAASAAQQLLGLTEEVRAQGLPAESPLLRTVLRAEPVVLRIQERLDAWEHAARVNAVWRNRNVARGAAWGLFVFIILTEIVPTRFMLGIFLLLAGGVVWRLWGLREFAAALRSLGRALPVRVPPHAPPVEAPTTAAA